jgi:subtilisin family serine protease
MMHSEALGSATPPTARVVEPVVESASTKHALALDANGDGRIDLSEMKSWLTRWRQRSAGEDAEPALEADPLVAQPEALPDVLPAAPQFGGSYDWYLNAIGAPEAWAAGYTGRGVITAVIDTGVDLKHREFREQLWRNPGEVAGNGLDDDSNGFVDDVHGWDFVHDDATPQDRNGHGTHVASLIVGARNGVGSTGAAYGSQVMVLQGLGADGVGDTRDVARAVRYAVDEGADIINVSLSGARSSSLESAIRYANSQGVLVVAASGNQGISAPSEPASLSRTLSGVLSVGAYDQSERLASFSNGADGATQITAPGVRLRAAVPGGYAVYSGTSMAAPLVSGVAALALSAAPNLSAAQLRSLLVKGASDHIAGDDSHGAVNAAVTVAQAAKTVGAEALAANGSPLAGRISLSASISTISVRGNTAAASRVADAPMEFNENPFRVVSNRRPDIANKGEPLATRPLENALSEVRRSAPRHALKLWRPDDEDTGTREPLQLEAEAVDASIDNWAA